MKAIGYKAPCSIDSPDALVAFDAPEPVVGSNDLIVDIKAVSMNPVDTKVRSKMPAEPSPRILGYDAAGVVLEVGENVTLFEAGDEVFYAGDLTRPGTNAQRHAVDQRIVGKKPRSLDFASAAALPLTAITAWELLFESLAVREGAGAGETLLIVGGAGGVGSILIQLAKQLTALTVVASASRPETVAWVKKMGADHAINHHEGLQDQLAELGLVPRYVASLTATDQHFPALVELIQPRGHIALIDDPQPLDINSMKPKALSFSWEFMFTRSMFQTPDMMQQHELLTRVSELIDAGVLVTTATENQGALSVKSLTESHRLQESGRTIGKIVLTGLES